MANNKSIQFFRGTSTQRKASSEVLLAGQPFFETDTRNLYIGTGSSTPLAAMTPINSNKVTSVNGATGTVTLNRLGIYYFTGKAQSSTLAGIAFLIAKDIPTTISSSFFTKSYNSIVYLACCYYINTSINILHWDSQTKKTFLNGGGSSSGVELSNGFTFTFVASM